MNVTTVADSQRITDAIWFTIYAGIVLILFAYLDHREVDHGPHRWQRWRDAIIGRYVLSSRMADDGADEDHTYAGNEALSREQRNGESGESGVATGKIAGNDPFQFPDLFTGLARLVVAEKLGETDALKIAVRASAGKSPRYVEARTRLHAALERERPVSGPQFAPLSEEQQAAREDLGLS